MSLRDKYKTFFYPTDVEDFEEYGDEVKFHFKEGGGGEAEEDGGEGVTKPDSEREETPAKQERLAPIDDVVKSNREMGVENRRRIVRIDERTAFIARIVFALFVAFVVAVGAGMAVAYVTSSFLLLFGVPGVRKRQSELCTP